MIDIHRSWRLLVFVNLVDDPSKKQWEQKHVRENVEQKLKTYQETKHQLHAGLKI